MCCRKGGNRHVQFGAVAASWAGWPTISLWRNRPRVSQAALKGAGPAWLQGIWYISAMQLELFPYDSLEPAEIQTIYSEIRRSYWVIRNLRDGRFGQARLRKQYRIVEVKKKRLLLAGVSKREILDLLACCRLQCSRHKHPFKPCAYC